MRIETIEEFLARGGIVERFDYIEPDLRQIMRPKKPAITAANLSLEEGEHLFGVIRKSNINRPRKMKPVDMSCIPEHLRRFMKGPTDGE